MNNVITTKLELSFSRCKSLVWSPKCQNIIWTRMGQKPICNNNDSPIFSKLNSQAQRMCFAQRKKPNMAQIGFAKSSPFNLLHSLTMISIIVVCHNILNQGYPEERILTPKKECHNCFYHTWNVGVERVQPYYPKHIASQQVRPPSWCPTNQATMATEVVWKASAPTALWRCRRSNWHEMDSFDKLQA